MVGKKSSASGKIVFIYRQHFEITIPLNFVGGGIIKLNHIFNEKVDRVLTNFQWYSLGIQASYDSKPSHYDISEKLLKFVEKSNIPSANRIT